VLQQMLWPMHGVKTRHLLSNQSRFVVVICFRNPQQQLLDAEETCRLTLVIGKKKNVDEKCWNQIIEQERPYANIIGFDELLDKAKKTCFRS
jgi:hypothetical protein